MNSLRLSVVIPAYNEEGNLPNTIQELQGDLRAAGIPYEIIIVNDNSRDGTAAVTSCRHCSARRFYARPRWSSGWPSL